ncbi:MAG TPA: hypothetical protein VIT65_20540 [Microlunatus sp.]
MSKDKERFDKDLDVDPHVEDDSYEEIDPPDLGELEEHLQSTGRDFEASEDYDDEDEVEVESEEEVS